MKNSSKATKVLFIRQTLTVPGMHKPVILGSSIHYI
jgi:hypothetical protein